LPDRPWLRGPYHWFPCWLGTCRTSARALTFANGPVFELEGWQNPAWPSTTGLAERFTDPAYALAFARIVTHYVRHNAWLEDGILLRGADALADIPGILVNGRFDFQATIAPENGSSAESGPRAELVIVDDAGHVPTASLSRELFRATKRFPVDPGAVRVKTEPG
jgi:pimeloyl-ACP methyl ester carboxylesterase